MSCDLNSHEFYMGKALALAIKSRGNTAPNPMVGCVIVKDNQIIASGYHQQAGHAHAEVAAIKNFFLDNPQNNPTDLADATIYVTLEPCCHTGRTDPCTASIIQYKFKTAVIAMLDPNPLVAGRGVELLQKAGIEVIVNIGEQAARQINAGFISRMTNNRPYVRSKIAASLDGHIALGNGESKWITNSLCREDVHLYRLQSDAIVTTAATVLADNPQLMARVNQQHSGLAIKQPLRVVIDKDLLTSPEALIYVEQDIAKTIIITSVITANMADKHSKIKQFQDNHITIYYLEKINNKINMLNLFELLAELGCNDVLVEAGGRFNGYLLANNLVDEWIVYQSGQVMGPGAQNMFSIDLQGSMSNLIKLKCEQIKQFDDNWRVILTPCLPE